MMEKRQQGGEECEGLCVVPRDYLLFPEHEAVVQITSWHHHDTHSPQPSDTQSSKEISLDLFHILSSIQENSHILLAETDIYLLYFSDGFICLNFCLV